LNVIQHVSSIRNRGNRNPAEIYAERNANQPALQSCGCRLSDFKAGVNEQQCDQQSDHRQQGEGEKQVVPEKDPDSVRQIGDHNCPANLHKPRILTPSWQRLIHGESQQSQIDQSPDAEDIPGGYEVSFEAIRDLTGVQTIQRQTVCQTIHGQGDQGSHYYSDLSKGIFHWELLSKFVFESL